MSTTISGLTVASSAGATVDLRTAKRLYAVLTWGLFLCLRMKQ